MKTITLTKGKEALVSDEDYEWLSQWKWTATVYNFAAERLFGEFAVYNSP